MLSSDVVRQTPRVELIDPEKILGIRQAILAIEDIDDRYLCLYALVSRLLEENLWEQAEEFTRLMQSWALEQSWFLGDIATKAWQAGKSEHANSLFVEAIELSRKNGSAWQRGEGLLRIARHYLEIGDRHMALELLSEAAEIARHGQNDNNIQDAVDSSGVLREVAESIAATGEISQARQIAQSIFIDARREAALATIQKLDSAKRNAG